MENIPDNFKILSIRDKYITVSIKKRFDDTPNSPEIEVTSCYTPQGYYIGDLYTAQTVCDARGISPEPPEGCSPWEPIPCSYGWSEKEGVWYGWGHRGIAGFSINSEVKKEHIAYVPVDMEDFKENLIWFWSDIYRRNITAKEIVDTQGNPCVLVEWEYSNDPDLVPNEHVRGKNGGIISYPPKPFGRGEWVAKTLEDAKQMAMDYAKNIG